MSSAWLAVRTTRCAHTRPNGSKRLRGVKPTSRQGRTVSAEHVFRRMQESIDRLEALPVIVAVFFDTANLPNRA